MRKMQFQSVLADELGNFVRLRRLSGTDYQSQTRLLQYFDRFLLDEMLAEGHITREITDRYQGTLSRLSPRGQSNRFCVVRQFCEYLSLRDSLTYVPERMRSVSSQGARVPYIYTPEQVTAMLGAASRLGPSESLRPTTFRTLFGLLYATGIRIGEALGLDLEDLHSEPEALYIREGKFRKDRWVPLTSSTIRALEEYREQRLLREPRTPDAPFFINLRGRRLRYPTVHQAFREVLPQAGISYHKNFRPRLHDFRHTFAVHRLLQWYRDGDDVNARLPSLATYLGHVNIRSTQVYLQATPELLEQVDHRFRTYYLNHVNPKGELS